jgi:hypothetical protein
MLYNASKRSRNVGHTLLNIEQGGGEKKAGLPYIIGRTANTQIYFKYQNNTVDHWKKMPYTGTVNISKNIGTPVTINTRYQI